MNMPQSAVPPNSENPISPEIIERINQAIPEKPDTRMSATENTTNKDALAEIVIEANGDERVLRLIIERLENAVKADRTIGQYWPDCELSTILHMISKEKNFSSNSSREEAQRIAERREFKLQALGKKYIAYGRMLPKKWPQEDLPEGDNAVEATKISIEAIGQKRQELRREWVEIAAASIVLAGANDSTLRGYCSASSQELVENITYDTFQKAEFEEKDEECNHEFLLREVYARIMGRVLTMSLAEARTLGLTDAENIADRTHSGTEEVLSQA